MVLSWRDNDKTNRIFDGSGDLKIFMFYFENVAMRGKPQEDKCHELIAHLDGEAFRFFFEKFTEDGKLSDEETDFERVKAVFIEEYGLKEERQEIIRQATEATLDPQSLLQSLAKIEKLYGKENFDEGAKFGFLRMAVTKLPHLATLAMYRGESD